MRLYIQGQKQVECHCPYPISPSLRYDVLASTPSSWQPTRLQPSLKMRAVTRVGASICLSVCSLVSIILLLPSSQVSTQLQKIALGTTLDRIPTLWNWAAETDDQSEGRGVRLVVFGDSWVDDSLDGESGKGKSWAQVVCDEVRRSIVTRKGRNSNKAADQLYITPQLRRIPSPQILSFLRTDGLDYLKCDLRVIALVFPVSSLRNISDRAPSRSGCSNPTLHRSSTPISKTQRDTLSCFLRILGYIQFCWARIRHGPERDGQVC